MERRASQPLCHTHRQRKHAHTGTRKRLRAHTHAHAWGREERKWAGGVCVAAEPRHARRHSFVSFVFPIHQPPATATATTAFLSLLYAVFAKATPHVLQTLPARSSPLDSGRA